MYGVFAVCQCDHRGTVNNQKLKVKNILVIVATEVDVHIQAGVRDIQFDTESS